MFLFAAGAVIGALLGLRYKVFVLVPATSIAIATVVLVGIANADSFGRIVVAVIAMSSVLQLGYVLGTVIDLIMDARSRNVSRKYSVSTSAGVSKPN